MLNPNYNKTITVYNCLQAKDSQEKKERWYRRTLHDCFFKAQTTETANGTQVQKANVYVARIPEDKDYLPYKKWKELQEEERQKKFTFSEGDIIICGECLEEIAEKNGQTAVSLLQKYKPDAFRITAFSDNTGFLTSKHYRVGG